MTFRSSILLPLIAALSITAPQEGERVATLKPFHKAFIALAAKERPSALADKDYRQKMNETGSEPASLVIRWHYEPTLESEGPLTEARFRVVLTPQSDPFAAEWFSVAATNALVVDNLRIAEPYGLEVAVVDGRGQSLESARTTFRTEETAPRFIRMAGVKNVRDLGGWKTLDGRRVRQGLVYRSQGLNENADWCVRDPVTAEKTPKPRDEWKPGKVRGTPLSRAEVRSRLGIRTELDLRRPESETWAMEGSPLGPSVRWVNRRASSYAGLATDHGRAAFVDAFRLFLEPENYPIDFHCIAGADRTGSLAYVLNGLLGVPEDDLDLDYELTCFVQPHRWPGNRTDPGCTNALARLKSVFAAYPGETIHARIENYVRSCGFTDDDLRRFRSVMFGETPVLPKLTKENVRTVFGGASAMQRRQMMQDESVRKIMNEAAVCANFRDLGGRTGCDGRRLRTNRVFRCAALERVDAKDLQPLLKGAVPKTELDLRTPDKAQKGLATDGARYVNRSAPCYAAFTTEKGRAWFAETFRLFLDEANYPIVFHCAKGADRTGTLAFVLEGLLGVDEDELLRDWQETAFWNANFRFQTDRYDRLLQAMDAYPGDTWGEKIVSYAHACGITDAEIGRFRELMLEPTAVAPPCRLRLGVISDTHLRLLDGFDRLERAFRTFRRRQVDAVVVSGDVTDTGKISEFARFHLAWNTVFHASPGKDGAPDLFLVWGNHDVRASAKDRAANVSMDDVAYMSATGGCDRVWQMIFGEPYPGDIYARKIRGVTFVGAQWKHENEIGAWLKAHSDLTDSDQIFFYVQHPHPSDTVYGMRTSAVRATKDLSGCPNCFAISGHSHTTVADGQSLWQGAFTSLAAGTPNVAAPRHGPGVPTYANGCFKPRNAERPYPSMSTCGLGRASHGSVLSLYDDALVIERIDFASGKKVDDDVRLPLPLETHPEDPFVVAAGAAAPEFPPEATVKVRVRDGRNAMGEPERQLYARVEQARAVSPHGRAIVNTFEVLDAETGAVLASADALQPGQGLPVEDGYRHPAECAFALDALPKDRRVQVRVTPRNAAGKGGRPLLSTPLTIPSSLSAVALPPTTAEGCFNIPSGFCYTIRRMPAGRVRRSSVWCGASKVVA